jgi:hypothetical protein
LRSRSSVTDIAALSDTDTDSAKPKKIMYVLALFSATEMKKPATKRTAKNGSIRLNTNEPWDTVKAQLLVQISNLLKPQLLDFSQYETNFYIPRVLPKPGLPLLNDADYDYMIERARSLKSADLIINLIVVEKGAQNKENVQNAQEVDKGAEGKCKKKVRTHICGCLCSSDEK